MHLIDFLPHQEFLEFVSKNIDIGFVSLIRDYYGACVPSKIYEYINLGLPIIGALPDGDGKDIVNRNNYGFACHYDDIGGICDSITKLKNKKILQSCQDKILKDKSTWSMENKIKEIYPLLKDLAQ